MMAENLVTPEKSINESDVLLQLSYKEVQQIAMSMKLPANLKHTSLVALVKAHQSADFNEVDRIVSENRQLRSRGRLSRTTSTSPAAESLTLSPPISPECLSQVPALPLASSSPINEDQPRASNSLPATTKNLLHTICKSEQTAESTETQETPLETAIHLLCKETFQPHEEHLKVGSSGTVSSDRSPDPLELESTSTYCSDSRTNSAASDIDPLAKDLTELKPVPPSELMDLSLSEPLLDSSLILRPNLNSLQADTFLPPIQNLTQTLMQFPSVEEEMLPNNPLVHLCAPDSMISEHVDSSVLENKRVEHTQAGPGHSDVTPLENVNVGEPFISCERPNSLKRQSIESHFSPSKLPKTSTSAPSKIQQFQTVISTASSNLLPLPLVSQEFPKLPCSLSIIPVPTSVPSATAYASIMPPPLIITTSSHAEGQKMEPTTSTTLSESTPNKNTNLNARKTCMYPTTKSAIPNMTNLPIHSIKSSSAESCLGPLLRPNIQISESMSQKVLPSVPKRGPSRNILLLKGTVNKASSLSKKSSAVKSSQEICHTSPDMAHVPFRPMVAKPLASPVKKSIANPVYSASGNASYARQNVRTPIQHPTTSVTTSAAPLVALRRPDQPTLHSNPCVFASSSLPMRNPMKIATPIPRPARPESVVNFHPPPPFPQPNLPPSFTQPNLPSFNHLLRDQVDHQKYVQSRQPEVCSPYPVGHGDATGESLLNLVQPRIDFGTHPLPHMPPPSRHPPMDFPPPLTASGQSSFIGPNSSTVGQNLSHDGCLSTLRQLLEGPVYNGLPNRDPGRRNPFSPYQYDSQVPSTSQFIRPQPSDHHKDMTSIGQQSGNYPFQVQNFQRMPLMTIKPPESTEKLLETKEFLAEQRLGSADVPKCLEPIFNFRKDALSAASTTYPNQAVRSSEIDSLFVSSGTGETHSVDFYETPICSVKSKPTRSCHMGFGNHQKIERFRSPQEFVPYSSNYPTELQSTDMYCPPSLNGTALPNQQSFEPSWFANEQCVSAGLPANQYWPQAVNHQPPMRLPQPFRAVNPRNMPSHYYAPLKSLQMSNTAPAFFSQPPINNAGYQGGIQPPPPILPDVQSYQPPESFDKVLPLQESVVELVGQDPLAGPNQVMNQFQNQIHQDVPDFQGRGDQLSLSMIYNYLASTEHQVAANTPRPDHFDNQSQTNQRPVYSRPIFPGTVTGQHQQQFGNGSAAANSVPLQSSAVASTPTSRSKYSNATAKNLSRKQEVSESTTLSKEAATLSVLALRRGKERQRCVNFDNGCCLVLPQSQLAAHEACCEYINLKCPKEKCDWNGRARKLANHVREAHRTEINSGTDSKHSLPDIDELERVCFLQEVSRKLFAICVNCHGGVLYVSIQYIASGRSERPTTACGCIEVLGHDGHPHSWRGKLLPYFQSIETLLTTSSCLEVSLNTLGVFPGPTITLHVNIRVYSGNTNSTPQPSH